MHPSLSLSFHSCYHKNHFLRDACGTPLESPTSFRASVTSGVMMREPLDVLSKGKMEIPVIRGCQVFKLNVQRLSIQTVLKLKISGVTGVISGGDESRSCVYGAYKEYKCSENYSES